MRCQKPNFNAHKCVLCVCVFVCMCVCDNVIPNQQCMLVAYANLRSINIFDSFGNQGRGRSYMEIEGLVKNGAIIFYLALKGLTTFCTTQLMFIKR